MSLHVLPPDPTPELISELAVLAGILEANDRIDDCRLRPDDFATIVCEDTFKLMEQLRSEHRPITPVSLADLNPRHAGLFWEIGDAAAAERNAWAYHCERVREQAARRKLASAASRILQLAEQEADAMGVDELHELSRRLVDDAWGLNAAPVIEDSASVAVDVVSSIGKTVVAYPTPWPQLTGSLRGLRPGSLYVLAARPGVGKSALALQFATTVEQHGTVGFFTIEMSKHEVVRRMISQVTMTTYSMLDGAQEMPGWARDRVHEWLTDYATRGRILIDDRSMITISDIRAQVRTWKRERPDLKLIVVDYLQLITGAPGVPRHEVVSSFSRELKVLAGEFGIAVLALSQLNRNPEQRADKRPAMSDLRESGAIEQDADSVLLLHRDYGEGSAATGAELELIIAKNRQGPTTSVWLQWHGEFMLAIES